MTVSCQTWGWEWGSDAMLETMDDLKSLGVNWIAIHPYAGIRADGTVRMPRRLDGGERLRTGHDDAVIFGDSEEPVWLTRPIAEAHKRGIKIMIKPHLAYWGSPFSWRGDIAFETEEQWERFFTTYDAWITRLARICADADAFVVGTELDRTTRFESEWRDIIKKVRAETKAPLTYSANWTDYRKVPFWDALDCIGVQAYFPLAADVALPEEKDLVLAWRGHLQRMEAYAERVGKPIVFGELGYNTTALAAKEPWSTREIGDHREECQRRCLHAALGTMAGSDVVVGAFCGSGSPDRSGTRTS